MPLTGVVYLIVEIYNYFIIPMRKLSYSFIYNLMASFIYFYQLDYCFLVSSVIWKEYNVMLCSIWYHLYDLKNVKNSLGGVLLLVKSQASASNFKKRSTPQWVLFKLFKIYKLHQIAQSISYLPSQATSSSTEVFYKNNFLKIWQNS